MSAARRAETARLNGAPVVREGRLHRPVPVVVDELVVRDARGERRLYWSPSGFGPEPWGERP